MGKSLAFCRWYGALWAPREIRSSLGAHQLDAMHMLLAAVAPSVGARAWLNWASRARKCR